MSRCFGPVVVVESSRLKPLGFMAFRGRGRGRGGRGAARPGPLIRDEDGSLITSFKLDEPPPLFPKVETLPERPDITQAETVFHLERRRMLQTFWNQSAYFLEEKSEKTCANDDLHGEGSSSSSTVKRKPLSLYLLLTPDFFPTELLGNARKRKATHQGGMWTLQTSDLGRLEKLAKLEAKIGEKGEGDEEKKEEDDEDNIDQAFDEEEEEVDDYNMMQEIDDDEEYDYEEGGEDEGPTY